MNLSVKQLRAFAALRAHKNFTQAAQTCHLSQSAFSALIQNLEADAGVRLFDRNTRHVELTPEGEAFAESALRRWPISRRRFPSCAIAPRHAPDA